MRAAKRLQLSTQLTAAARTTLEPTIGASLILPIFWAEEASQISAVQAAAFRASVYGARRILYVIRSWSYPAAAAAVAVVVVAMAVRVTTGLMTAESSAAEAAAASPWQEPPLLPRRCAQSPPASGDGVSNVPNPVGSPVPLQCLPPEVNEQPLTGPDGVGYEGVGHEFAASTSAAAAGPGSVPRTLS